MTPTETKLEEPKEIVYVKERLYSFQNTVPYLSLSQAAYDKAIKIAYMGLALGFQKIDTFPLDEGCILVSFYHKLGTVDIEVNNEGDTSIWNIED